MRQVVGRWKVKKKLNKKQKAGVAGLNLILYRWNPDFASEKYMMIDEDSAPYVEAMRYYNLKTEVLSQCCNALKKYNVMKECVGMGEHP
jgi:hypothetical protein